jgi:hypothetical protein
MKHVVAVIFLVALAGTAFALEPPDTDLLKTRLAVELPSYWQITELQPEASAN